MTIDHKAALEKHLSRLPAHPGQLLAGSPAYPRKGKTYDAATTAAIAGGTIPVKNDKAFTDYTGFTHLGLLQSWATGSQLTSCNSFVFSCCAAMGAKTGLGKFELEALLKKLGKAHAWVPAGSGARPEYGDVYTIQEPIPGKDYMRLHMGVSLGFEGETWLTAEGGKGGPSRGVDAVARCKQAFDPKRLLGWCSMKVFLDDRPPAPDWVLGWWVIYHGKDLYHYHFNRSWEVHYEPWKPVNTGSGPTMPMDKASYAVGPGDTVTITWRCEGGTERFTYDRWNSLPGVIERMTGTSASGEPLTGVSLGPGQGI